MKEFAAAAVLRIAPFVDAWLTKAERSRSEQLA
jgi:hypothetical protein